MPRLLATLGRSIRRRPWWSWPILRGAGTWSSWWPRYPATVVDGRRVAWGEFRVLGGNRSASTDGRTLASVPKDEIVGRPDLRAVHSVKRGGGALPRRRPVDPRTRYARSR
ncbi:MAG: S26 family signal peptidase [Actinomycetota bacterium]